MALQEEISALLEDKQLVPSTEWVNDMTRRYPYFTLPASMMLKRATSIDENERNELTAHVALCSSDNEKLMRLADKNSDRWVGFYPEEASQKAMNTDATIDTFIKMYGNPDPHEEEILTRLIFNPTPDYAQLLAEEEERSVPNPVDVTDDSQDAKINAFILKSREQQGHFPSSVEKEQEPEPVPIDNTPVNAPEETDDSLLSESLAKIYIKQRRYSKAYEIISNLSLNFPEKSIYFADQLRFLRKLMLNQRHN